MAQTKKKGHIKLEKKRFFNGLQNVSKISYIVTEMDRKFFRKWDVSKMEFVFFEKKMSFVENFFVHF